MNSQTQKTRIKEINDEKIQKGNFVVYWMQASQRVEFNHALEYAIEKSDELDKPLIVFFGLTDDYPEANKRHYRFMLEGLSETKASLAEKNIQLVLWKKSPEEGAIEMAEEAALMVVDKGYLDVQRKWRERASKNLDCPIVEVESDVVVPVEEASDKEEYAARTIRPKIKGKLNKYLLPLEDRSINRSSLEYDFDSYRLKNLDRAVNGLDIDDDVQKTNYYLGGLSRAKEILEKFIEERLEGYPENSKDPSRDYLSHMSPYLHFGQISPLYIALKVSDMEIRGAEEYLEQLIIRRELSMNFTYNNPNYDNMKCLPGWARETLKEHENDEREYLYSLSEFEKAKTHDPYWNAAQTEMVETGKMHGYMRMYWGKKILEWSKSPRKAFETALHLNNKYELDGRDPNGYTGVAWCFGKHDRAWKERPIYGKVRYMSASGLERKFPIDEYVDKVQKKIS